MFCPNCGKEVGDFDLTCEGCRYTLKDNDAKIKTTGLLVWSVIEMISCYTFIPGLVGLILWINSLKPAANRGDVEGAKKAKKRIKISLWIGVAIWVLIFVVIALLVAIPNAVDARDITGYSIEFSDATRIGQAVRVWYVDAISDPELDYDIPTEWELTAELDDIYNYTSVGTTKDGKDYYTAIQNAGGFAPRVLIGVSCTGEDLPPVSDVDGVTYDGNGSGVCYVEYIWDQIY